MQFAEWVLKTLVNHPNEVLVRSQTDDMGVLVMAKLHPDDYGRIIGKQGATIKAIRELMKVASYGLNVRVSFKLDGDPRAINT